jgi:hypothetical protein
MLTAALAQQPDPFIDRKLKQIEPLKLATPQAIEMTLAPQGRYPHIIRTPGEATDIALAIQDGIRTARRDYGNVGTMHLFMAAPAGPAMLIGQLLNTFGSVQIYEHVAVDGGGQYRPAALLRPNI